MTELLDVANAFSTPLKVAWIVWLAWGIGQAYWFKHERANAAAPKLPKAPRAPRKALLKRDKAVQPVGRLITPQHVAPKPQPAPEAAPVFEQPVFETPAYSAQAFDPSKAVVETFDPRGAGSLDAIVADMEAHMPREVGRDASHIH